MEFCEPSRFPITKPRQHQKELGPRNSDRLAVGEDSYFLQVP